MTDELQMLYAPVTLCDGTQVPSNDKRWLDECASRARHVANLRHLDLRSRRDYVEQVGFTEGDEASARLVAAYGADFEQRRAAARAAKADPDKGTSTW